MKKGLATPNWIIMSKDRTQAISWKIALENAGYESKKWWGEGCHIMEAYASFQRANLTNTESISSRYLGIPFHLYLPDEYWEKMELIFSQLPS
jgi:hypothetical protein